MPALPIKLIKAKIKNTDRIISPISTDRPATPKVASNINTRPKIKKVIAAFSIKTPLDSPTPFYISSLRAKENRAYLCEILIFS